MLASYPMSVLIMPINLAYSFNSAMGRILPDSQHSATITAKSSHISTIPVCGFFNGFLTFKIVIFVFTMLLGSCSLER